MLKSKNACGLVNLSARFLKDSASVIAPSVATLINCSFRSGRFPKIWQSAKVVALFKIGDETDPNNYRPISTLPKIVDGSARVQLNNFIQLNNLLMPSQHGFRQRKSTITSSASKFMLIGIKRRLQHFNDVTIVINDEHLGRVKVTELKYLGVILEETLS